VSLKAAARAIVPAGVWRVLRRLHRRMAVKRFSPRVVEHRLGSSMRKLWIADPLGEAWYDHDWAEPPEISRLKQARLRPGSRVFDLGAHQGVVALILAEAVGERGRVIAVEMNAHNAAVAERNRDLNAMGQITIRRAAVAETRGTITFNPNLNAAITEGESWGGHEVEGLSIDDLTGEYGPPDVLFIDIEGYECRALSGAAGTLALRPDCFIEVHVGHGLETFGGSVEELVRHFPAEAYTLLMSAGEDSPFVPFDPSSPMIRDRFFLIALSGRGGAPS